MLLLQHLVISIKSCATFLFKILSFFCRVPENKRKANEIMVEQKQIRSSDRLEDSIRKVLFKAFSFSTSRSSLHVRKGPVGCGTASDNPAHQFREVYFSVEER